MEKDIGCWFSAGVTSAVAIKQAIEIYGAGRCRVIMIDTYNEDEDSYRFRDDCEKWYGIPIEMARNTKYTCIQDVWRKYKSLNVAHGAICSSELKREVRIQYQRENDFKYNVFGFDIGEPKRAKNMTLNYPAINPIYPLLLYGYTKKKSIEILNEAGIDIPRAYKWGLHNNNCGKTGCVQGGIGYWQLMRNIFPDKFEAMAAMEHELTDISGKPITMLKDQSKGGGLVFLLPHPDYPYIKDISMMKGRQPEPLTDCNGYCGVNDGIKSNTALELNFNP